MTRERFEDALVTTTAIDKPLLKKLRVEIEAALQGIGDAHGVSLQLGNARYSATDATFKLLVGVLGEGGEVETRETRALKTLFGDQAYDALVRSAGRTFRLKEYHSRRKKWPFVGEESETGKRYKLPPEIVTQIGGRVSPWGVFPGKA